MRRIVLKEGPLVFLRDLIINEIVASIVLVLVSFLENYEQLYRGLVLAKYLRYDLFLMLAFSIFQIIVIVLLCLNWYFSHYEIGERDIVRKTGILFRRRKAVDLSDVVSVEIYQSPLSRLMYHATIILEHGNGRVTKIKNVGNFEEYVHLIRQAIAAHSHGDGRNRMMTPEGLARLISGGEGMYLEFKETLRYDARKGETSKDLERAVLKGIVGFLNSDGGTLLVGVNDAGTITGIERDYNSLPKKNRDGFENHLTMLIRTMIGLPFAKYIAVHFESIEGKDICAISVRPSHKAAYLASQDGREEFFVRVGNSSQPFSMSQTQEYIKSKWGR